MDSTTQHHHTDSKTLRKEKEKKIALGHKEDDHEDEQTYIWQQTMWRSAVVTFQGGTNDL